MLILTTLMACYLLFIFSISLDIIVTRKDVLRSDYPLVVNYLFL